eukprot:TRINITY_DN948_c1_g1_i5.p1 TRINITY_DN948_c1_g1~~TRINITY_DN948_c1_g1_i5.p1  ORF type:complete len:191 (+),score=14.03 TRINITY_DN948_c1_g1_i5:37-573(+)
MTTDEEEGACCHRCGKQAKLSCPKCAEMNMPKKFAAFCSQDCFQQSWQGHKKLHKVGADSWMYVSNRGKGRENLPPKFEWTGNLRPDRVGPRRIVPQNIPLPDYALTGIPHGELRSRQQNLVSIRSEEEIQGIRAAVVNQVDRCWTKLMLLLSQESAQTKLIKLFMKLLLRQGHTPHH